MSRRVPDSRAVAAVAAGPSRPARPRRGRTAAAAPPRLGARGADAKVKLQLQWFTQGQFAGYFAAVDQGFYPRTRAWTSQIMEGGVDIVPQTVLAQGQADYAIAWVPKALASREQGAGITDVAQIFQRSGTYQVSFKDKGITAPADLRGKKVGNWGFGNEFELFAGMTQGRAQARQRRHARAAAVRHAGPAQRVRSTPRRRCPTTSTRRCWRRRTRRPGSSTSRRTSTIINWNDAGTAMLQDAIWANTEKLVRPGLPGHHGQVHRRVAQGLDLLPRQRRVVPRHRRQGRVEARREPPAVAGQRGQQADLAVARRPAPARSTRRRGTRPCRWRAPR